MMTKVLALNLAISEYDDSYCRFGFSVTAVITFLASVASAVSPSYPFLVVSRAVVGLGLGGAPVVFSLFMEFVSFTCHKQFFLIVFLLLGGFFNIS